jgi:hypothetical protein
MTWYYVSRFARNSTATKIANVVLAKSSKRLRRDRLVSMPYRYTIDPTNTCNLRCPLCPTGLGILGRERGRMKVADFQRVVDEIAPFCYLLELYNWGEPFLHPGIFDMISYAHQRKILVRLSSNLNHFNEEMARKTVEAGAGKHHRIGGWHHRGELSKVSAPRQIGDRVAQPALSGGCQTGRQR